MASGQQVLWCWHINETSDGLCSSLFKKKHAGTLRYNTDNSIIRTEHAATWELRLEKENQMSF